MLTTPHLTIASIKMMLRNKQTVFFSLFIPFVIMGIFGLMNFDSIPPIHVGIVTQQPTPATEQFITQLGDFQAFKISRGTDADERKALADGDRTLVLIVPDAFMPDPASTTPPSPQTLNILRDPGQAQQAQTGLTILQQTLDKTTIAVSQAPELFRMEVEDVSARSFKYINFLVPGVVALAIMQMAVFSVAFVFADYKEKGVLKRLLATPMKPYQFVTANVITRLIVALAQAAILIAVGVLLFKVEVVGSYWLVLLTAILGGIMFLGLGFTISGIAKTVDAVPALANIVVFPMMFLGGTFFPIDTMPQWLQNVVQYLPLTYFTHSIRGIIIEGAGFGDITHDLIWMAIWSVVFVGLAIMTFRFEEKRV